MDTGIPAPLSIVLLLFILLSLILRLTLLNSSVTDKRLNIAMVSGMVCCFLRDGTIQTAIVNWSPSWLSPALLYELSEYVVCPALCALFLVAYTWINRSEPRCLAPIVYVAMAISSIIGAGLKIDALSKNDTLNIGSDWTIIAYLFSSSPKTTMATMIFYDLLLCGFSAMVLVTCIREFCSKLDKRVAAIIASTAVMAIGFPAQAISISIAAIIVAAGRRNVFIDIVDFANRLSIWFYTTMGAGVSVVPAFTRLLERLHLDKFSRQRRQLLPLWRDLTTACPEIVYLKHGNLASNQSRYLLHRTVVEIRDCILILSRYCSHRDEGAIRAVDGNPMFRQAIRLALAWSIKIAGGSPSGDFVAQQSTAMDLPDEIRELSKLADAWVNAKNIVAGVTYSAGRHNEAVGAAPPQVPADPA